MWGWSDIFLALFVRFLHIACNLAAAAYWIYTAACMQDVMVNLQNPEYEWIMVLNKGYKYKGEWVGSLRIFRFCYASIITSALLAIMSLAPIISELRTRPSERFHFWNTGFILIAIWQLIFGFVLFLYGYGYKFLEGVNMGVFFAFTGVLNFYRVEERLDIYRKRKRNKKVGGHIQGAHSPSERTVVIPNSNLVLHKIKPEDLSCGVVIKEAFKERQSFV